MTKRLVGDPASGDCLAVAARQAFCVREEDGSESSDLLAVRAVGPIASHVELVIDLDKWLRSCRSTMADAVVHPGREGAEFPVAVEKAAARGA